MFGFVLLSLHIKKNELIKMEDIFINCYIDSKKIFFYGLLYAPSFFPEFICMTI